MENHHADTQNAEYESINFIENGKWRWRCYPEIEMKNNWQMSPQNEDEQNEDEGHKKNSENFQSPYEFAYRGDLCSKNTH